MDTLDTLDTFGPYAAGFFDGEGWVVIGREAGKNGGSDNHHIGIYITQRARHRAVLDKLQETFGGVVSVRDTKLKGRETWAEQADWHIHKHKEIGYFCRVVGPYCIVKAKQISIALEYVTVYRAGEYVRDELGRYRGQRLSAEEIARRERLRLELQVANERGSTRTVQVERPLKHVERPEVPSPANRGTISRGEHRPLARLTDEAVRMMRKEYAAGGITMRALALRYGVTPAAISLAVRRLSWQHVTDEPDIPDSAPPDSSASSPVAAQPMLFSPDA